MAAVIVCSDFGSQEITSATASTIFPFYLPWSDGTGCHDHSFFNSMDDPLKTGPSFASLESNVSEPISMTGEWTILIGRAGPCSLPSLVSLAALVGRDLAQTTWTQRGRAVSALRVVSLQQPEGAKRPEHTRDALLECDRCVSRKPSGSVLCSTWHIC